MGLLTPALRSQVLMPISVIQSWEELVRLVIQFLSVVSSLPASWMAR